MTMAATRTKARMKSRVQNTCGVVSESLPRAAAQKKRGQADACHASTQHEPRTLSGTVEQHGNQRRVHSRAVWSDEHDAIAAPLPENATHQTLDLWPASTAQGAAVVQRS